ncbi:proline-, glutamic acid- and leucine-rich protein 1 isoform X2 [Drosophila rhopaloa]|uniref:Proline-, glutamic acid- and leucine-rich protein 1 n=1 Tax=Drosophila rhopaloa TaxID=1041015 RepID=A0ABM5J656_DRORH|nr:proline-, glutamic acid- and leucine-rich protein 1 isoform X2 [Drosophila rhopaloa]
MDQHITSTLKKRKSRVLGFRLLICYLKKRNIKLGENEHIWMSIIFQSCNLSELRTYGDLIFAAMALLIDRIQSDANLSKAFATTYLSKVFECLSLKEIFKNERCTLAALHAIKRCLKYYPKVIKSGTTSIEKLLIILIDSTNIDVVCQTGECWLLLQNIRGNSNNENSNIKTVWKDFQLSLLNNINCIINKTLLLPEEIIDSPSKANNFGLSTLELVKDPFERALQIFGRICNLIEYFKIALGKPYVMKKYICTHQILGLIHKGLNLHVNQRNNIRMDQVYFRTFLPEMHIKLLELLEILIDICHAHLRMDFRLILNILMDALERTKSMLSEANRNQVIRIRLIVYKVISLWCSTLKEGSHCEIISETLIKEILDDIDPRDATALTCRGNSNLMQKGSVKDIYLMLEMSFGDEDNDLLRQEAHFCLRKLLSSSGFLLKQSLLKDVHNTLLEIFIKIHSQPMKKPYLRNIWNCRLEVYRSFIFLLKSRNYRCPVPSEIMITLLDESRLNENSIELRQNCNINALEIMLHPQKADITFKKYFENVGIITTGHTNITDSDNSKWISLKDISQLHIHADENEIVIPSNQKEKEKVSLQTGPEAINPLYKKNVYFSETSSKITTIDVNDKYNIEFDNNLLKNDKCFEKLNTNRFEIIPELLNDSAQNVKEISKESCHFLVNDKLESFENRDQEMINGNDSSGFSSSYYNFEKCVKNLPKNLGKYDDEKMIADLEAEFVGELK